MACQQAGATERVGRCPLACNTRLPLRRWNPAWRQPLPRLTPCSARPLAAPAFWPSLAISLRLPPSWLELMVKLTPAEPSAPAEASMLRAAAASGSCGTNGAEQHVGRTLAVGTACAAQGRGHGGPGELEARGGHPQPATPPSQCEPSTEGPARTGRPGAPRKHSPRSTSAMQRLRPRRKPSRRCWSLRSCWMPPACPVGSAGAHERGRFEQGGVSRAQRGVLRGCEGPCRRRCSAGGEAQQGQGWAEVAGRRGRSTAGARLGGGGWQGGRVFRGVLASVQSRAQQRRSNQGAREAAAGMAGRREGVTLVVSWPSNSSWIKRLVAAVSLRGRGRAGMSV